MPGLHQLSEALPHRGYSCARRTAHIIDERCIDCGECIRVCDYHAKVAVTDPLSSISRFKYKIALPRRRCTGSSRICGTLRRS